jgi:hypothetical protein
MDELALVPALQLLHQFGLLALSDTTGGACWWSAWGSGESLYITITSGCSPQYRLASYAGEQSASSDHYIQMKHKLNYSLIFMYLWCIPVRRDRAWRRAAAGPCTSCQGVCVCVWVCVCVGVCGCACVCAQLYLAESDYACIRYEFVLTT